MIERPTPLDLNALEPTLAGIGHSIATAAGSPALQAVATQVEAAVQTASVTFAETPDPEAEWHGVRTGNHLGISGPGFVLSANTDSGGVHVAVGDRTLQIDSALDKVVPPPLAGGLGHLGDHLRSFGSAPGTKRVRLSDHTGVIADWTFGVEGAIDNRDFEAQLEGVRAEIDEAFARAGTPGETPPTRADIPSPATTGQPGTSAGSITTAVAQAALRRLAQKAAAARSRPSDSSPDAERQPRPSKSADNGSSPAGDRTPRAVDGDLDDVFSSMFGKPPTTPPSKVCVVCSSAVDPGSRFCSSCGQPVDTKAESVAISQPEEGHSEEWVYVFEPTPVRALTDHSRIVGHLTPGVWYLLMREDRGWAHVRQHNAPLEGWVPGSSIHRQGESQWVATHRIPAGGLDAWEAPDPSRPVTARVGEGTEVALVERLGDWANVRASNGWEGWVDGRRLLSL